MDTPPEDEEAGTVVYNAPDAMTAEIVRGMLAAEGIMATIGEQVTSAYAGPLAVGEGSWGEVRVADADAELAKALLEAYEAGRGETDSAEFARAAESAYDPEV